MADSAAEAAPLLGGDSGLGRFITRPCDDDADADDDAADDDAADDDAADEEEDDGCCRDSAVRQSGGCFVWDVEVSPEAPLAAGGDMLFVAEARCFWFF